jgi:arylsulfatase A-like enzyme
VSALESREACWNQRNRGSRIQDRREREKAEEKIIETGQMNTTTKMQYLIAIIPLCLISLLTSLSAAEERPNIIFILADDLGWTDTGTYGSQYHETPNIDHLASQGMKFMQHHHCQNCQPTRAALMSGQYGARTGVYTVGGINRFEWQSRPLRPVDNAKAPSLQTMTIANVLKNSGYATAMFGKWHLGEDKEYHPAARGFDEAIVSNAKHFDFETNPPTEYPQGQYLADFLTDRAVDFIRRKKDTPFFLYLPHFGVHSPHDALQEDEERFANKEAVGGHGNPTYAGMIYAVDRSVGRIMALLDELKLSENTVVIFSSDNGGVGGYDRPDGLMRDPGILPKGKAENRITDNAPLRSGKGSLYEGGTRVPFIVRWPAVVKPATACDSPSTHVDFFPTLLEMASAEKPAQKLDGASLVPLLKDPADKTPRPPIFQHFPGYLGKGQGEWRAKPVSTILAGEWKLLEFLEDGKIELYNLKDDIGETTNLAEKMSDKSAELLQTLHDWRKEINAPMPSPNTPVATDKRTKRKQRKSE